MEPCIGVRLNDARARIVLKKRDHELGPGMNGIAVPEIDLENKDFEVMNQFVKQLRRKEIRIDVLEC